MVRMVAADDPLVIEVHQALAPFVWRSFTAQGLCRRVVAAIDRARVAHARPDCAGHDEDLVEALVAFLEGRPWRSLTVGGLSRQLVSAARAWEQERTWFDIRLGLLLDGTG